ncbi:transglutaminase family protein [Marinomonas sp. 15G1-11]|uniref:Transglutaminase family protein n=1 Tax=Marinomonas phaeophyticola TaxID=3004091 RepID=A0ABT4JY95_9GAMM|nr:transglutaminase family protein [Marinomonas sp. 15G1-11]MCZ2723191.1 transglutaminase family protein [Marinomonas sp. 15G1-11]
MRYRVRHITEYKYVTPVSLCYNVAHLLPRDTLTQRCLKSSIQVHPEPISQQERTDYFGNKSFYFSVQDAHKKLVIDVVSELKIATNIVLPNLNQGPTCKEYLDLLAVSKSPDFLESREFLLDSPMIRASASLADYAREVFQDDEPLLLALRKFTTKIFTEFKFDPNVTTVATPLDQVLKLKGGVCQDFAHLAIGCLRSLGFPTRYMSGYLETLPPPGKEKLIGADASHAWFSVFLPDLGWVEFDPTNDVMPTTQHLVTAWGRDYSDVTPLQGVIFDGGEGQTLSVSVDVQRLAALN